MNEWTRKRGKKKKRTTCIDTAVAQADRLSASSATNAWTATAPLKHQIGIFIGGKVDINSGARHKRCDLCSSCYLHDVNISALWGLWPEPGYHFQRFAIPNKYELDPGSICSFEKRWYLWWKSNKISPDASFLMVLLHSLCNHASLVLEKKFSAAAVFQPNRTIIESIFENEHNYENNKQWCVLPVRTLRRWRKVSLHQATGARSPWNKIN